MGTLQFDGPASYRNYLRYSHEKHLLVEGQNDKRVFRLFLDEWASSEKKVGKVEDIRIESAEQLVSFGGKIGNREKVEIICASISSKSYANRLVGFVDRDFRGFDFNSRIQDQINSHNVSGRLVWSRGYSIENYCFDFETLRRPLRTFSITDKFIEALELFENVFEQTIQLACAASLAGRELELLGLVRRSVNQNSFDIAICESGKTLSLDLIKWKNSLRNQHKLLSEKADLLIERFRFWKPRVENSDFCVIRWLCHGHTGLSFLWAVYSCCIISVYLNAGYDEVEAKRNAQRVLKAEESVRFNACADLWVQRALGNHCEYPVNVFELLGLEFFV